MSPIFAIVGVLILFLVLLDAFETVVLPRRVTRQFRLSAWFYRKTWTPWARMSTHIDMPARREAFLGYFGPLSLIFLLALWASGLILGFTLLQYGIGEHLRLDNEPVNFWIMLYSSGETFFTLGYGDVVPNAASSRFLSVLEAGMGFAFLGTVIGYLPTIYSAFSRREIEISLLDARAGSPPTAAELLIRFGCCNQQDVLDEILSDWERWSAELLESHLSYPVLSFFRSQHNNQSWLGALTSMLDASALVMAGIEGIRDEQAKITFAMARHAAVDLAQVMNARYEANDFDRLPAPELAGLRETLAQYGLHLRDDEATSKKLADLRLLYEPYVQATARRLFIILPPWIHPEKKKDNWQSGPWDRALQAKSLAERVQRMDEHF